MKKFLTLILVLTGMVTTSSAKTIYLINNWGFTGMHLYLYNSDTDNNGWPGASLSSRTGVIGKSDGSTDYYTLDLGNWNYFIIQHDSHDYRTQSVNLTAADFVDGGFYEMVWDGEETIAAATLNTYNFQVTTTEAWENLYFWLWDANNNNYNLTQTDWPGVKVTGTNNVYNYTYRSYGSLTEFKFLLTKGNGQPQTCDMTAAPGENKFNVSVASSKIDDTWGLTVKTNASGYATWGDNWHAITIPSGIAYCAEDKGNGSATAHNVTNPAAYTAMLIKGEANTTYHFAPASTNETLDYTNAFKRGGGNEVASQTDGKYNYILNGDTFYAANGQNVGTNKAYLQLSEPAKARALVFEDEDITGISVVETMKQKVDGYFNIAGQRVAQPTKGLYIVNGKKVVIK